MRSQTSVEAAALAAVLAAAGCGVGAQPTATITVDTTERHQTMTGWEATAQAGQETPAFARIRDTLYDLAVNDLGLNRLRLEVRSGSEHRRDYWVEGRSGRLRGDAYRCARYQTLNDNDDPRRIDWGGFQFAELDHVVEHVVLPFRARLAARGELLHLNVTYVGFLRQCPRGARWDHADPEEYAEFVLAVVLHLRDRFGLVPDTWEVILEPDHTGRWTGAAIGRAMVAAAARLGQAGLSLRFVAPSTTSMARAVSWFDELARVPGAVPLLAEVSYHRYRGVSDRALRAIGTRAREHGVGAAMLEHIGSGYQDLHRDIALGMASAWSQYALAFPRDRDRGGLYYLIDDRDPAAPRLREGGRTRWLKPYFRHVRPGAVRVGAASDQPAAAPLAFVNADGRAAVVVKVDRGMTITLRGLAPGTFGATYTTELETDVPLPDARLARGGTLSARIPDAGVLSIFAR